MAQRLRLPSGYSIRALARALCIGDPRAVVLWKHGYGVVPPEVTCYLLRNQPAIVAVDVPGVAQERGNDQIDMI